MTVGLNFRIKAELDDYADLDENHDVDTQGWHGIFGSDNIVFDNEVSTFELEIDPRVGPSKVGVENYHAWGGISATFEVSPRDSHSGKWDFLGKSSGR